MKCFSCQKCLWILVSIGLVVFAVGFAVYEADGVDIRLKIGAGLFKLLAPTLGLTHQNGQPLNKVSRELLNSLIPKVEANMDSDEVKTIDLYIPTLSFKINETHYSEEYKSNSRLFIPKKAVNNTEPLGLIVWVHGGGFVLGSSRDFSSYSIGTDLVLNTQYYVLFIDYRLAPEYKFPHGLEDTYSILVWLSTLENHCLFETIDKNMCKSFSPVDLLNVHLGGDSAGGNFAVNSALLWQYRGPNNEDNQKSTEIFSEIPFYHDHGFHSIADDKMKIQSLLLVYPSLFPDPFPPSYKKFADAYFVPKETRTYFRHAYFYEDDDDDHDDEDDDNSIRKRIFSVPYLSSFKSDLISKLPKSLIILARLDPLIDEGVLFSELLKENNVPAELHILENVPHGFFSSTMLSQAQEAMKFISSFLGQ